MSVTSGICCKCSTLRKLRILGLDLVSPKLIFASRQFEPQTFDASILKSTLRLAARYQYPTLRDYAIKRLGQDYLDPIDRLALARNGNVTKRMSQAMDYLSHRAKPITSSEARVLGYDNIPKLNALRDAVIHEKGRLKGAEARLITPPTSHHGKSASSP
jgi:hypothetical protein